MLLNDKEFPSSTTYFDKHAELRAIAGSSSWFTEFQPVRFPSIENFHKLLFLFLQQRLCFFLTGPLVIFVAGYIQSFRALSFFFIILDDHPTIRLIFQKGVNLIPNFEIESFQFTLIQAWNDSCVYQVRCGNFKIIMNIFGVDADSRWDYRSNVDFVHFVWEHYERYPIKKFAITILPRDNAPNPLRLEGTRLLYRKHYRALSDGWWKNRDNCVDCVANFHLSLTAVALVNNLQMNALVLFAEGSLPPCVTYVLMHISILYNILNWMQTRPSSGTCTQSIQVLYVPVNSFFPMYPQFNYRLPMTLSKPRSIMIALENGHGIVTLIAISIFLLMLFRHFRI